MFGKRCGMIVATRVKSATKTGSTDRFPMITSCLSLSTRLTRGQGAIAPGCGCWHILKSGRLGWYCLYLRVTRLDPHWWSFSTSSDLLNGAKDYNSIFCVWKGLDRVMSLIHWEDWVMTSNQERVLIVRDKARDLLRYNAGNIICFGLVSAC